MNSAPNARLTIAIPTINRAGLLRRAIESAIAQTSDEIEILVSDNGSTDATPAVIAAYDDPRLHKLRREETVPAGAHGTLIFEQIRTEFVLVLSDDDYIEPEFSAEIIRLFDEHPELSFAYTGCIEHYDDAELPALVGPRVEPSLDFIAAHYAGKRQLSWCACVCRIADLRRLGPQPQGRIIGDMFFWTKIAFFGPVGCVARPLSHYSVLRPAGDNESRAVPVISWGEEVELLAAEVMENVRKAGASPAFQAGLQADMGRYVTRSVANQFLWARICGLSRLGSLRLVPAALKFRGWNREGLIRVAAAILLPRQLIRDLLVRSVKKMARSRFYPP